MTSFLGEYENNYEEILKDEESLINKLFFAFNIKSNRTCYLKVIDKENIKKFDYDFLNAQINKEKELSKICKSENIIELYDVLETNTHFILELEYSENNINNGVINKYGGLQGNKKFFRKLIVGIAKALKTLHENGIMHRDIRPHNLFFDEDDELDDVKIIKLGKFDCFTFIKDNESEPIGTILYAAPEILKSLEYDEKCDLWSLGLILYESYFGILPYGNPYKININTIMDSLFDKEFLLMKSKIPSFDILLNRLLTRDKEERMSYDEFFEFVFDENFMVNEEAFLQSKQKYIDLYNKIVKEEQPYYPSEILCQCYDPYFLYRNNIKRIMNLFKDWYYNDIINISFKKREKDDVFNNIIYYDENSKFIKELNKDCDYFRKITNGAFILCTDIISLNFIKDEIVLKNKRGQNTIFNLITTGTSCEKIMKYLNSNLDFKNCINKTCVFCMNIKNWSHLKNKYDIIYGLYNKQSDIKEFIQKFSSKDIKPYYMFKLITYSDYITEYKNRHETVSEFYGQSFEEYRKNLQNKEKLVKIEEEKNKIKQFKSYLNNRLITFEFRKDIEIFEHFMKNYLSETNIRDRNIWLIDFFETHSNDLIDYYISRFMFYLNVFAKENKKYYEKDKAILKKGTKMYYSDLLQYIRAIGKIIFFSTFTFVSNNELKAINYSGRNQSKEQYNINKLFSVIFIITNNYHKNWISNGIKIIQENEYKNENNNENEILYLPFSFFLLKDIKIDYNNFTADIYLETIGKTEILEEKIKEGNRIVYNEKYKIMEVKK